MRSRIRRIGLTIVSIAVGGYVTATGGCLSFAGERLLDTVDFCFIIDCTDGASGLLQPCLTGSPLFEDCPDQQP